MEVRKEDQRDQDEKVVEIEIERLRDFKNHPFKVQADSQMKELQESIKKYGILNPLIVRPRPEGFYEIISGHRRKYAAQQLKYTKVPVIIRYMLDEDAIISMIDANLQRERISPSEKAFAYKMKYDVLKRKAGRRKCSQVDYLTGKKSVEVISEECGDSPKQVQRYLKLERELNGVKENWQQDESHYAFCGGGFPIIVNDEFRGVAMISGLPHLEDHRNLVEVMDQFCAQKNA